MTHRDPYNHILKTLKVACSLDDNAVWQIWNLSGIRMSKSAARTYFQGQENKNYRYCSDNELVAFVEGLKRYLRDGKRFD
ncbi:MAG: DUF1456 family protein [bacterium]|nr:DUF1456 family protein [bacterium]